MTRKLHTVQGRKSQEQAIQRQFKRRGFPFSEEGSKMLLIPRPPHAPQRWNSFHAQQIRLMHILDFNRHLLLLVVHHISLKNSPKHSSVKESEQTTSNRDRKHNLQKKTWERTRIHEEVETEEGRGTYANFCAAIVVVEFLDDCIRHISSLFQRFPLC